MPLIDVDIIAIIGKLASCRVLIYILVSIPMGASMETTAPPVFGKATDFA
jgi:hypothetical protein